MINIVGLGCDPADLSAAAERLLRSGIHIILRTGTCPAAEGVRALGVPFDTLDGIYESSRSFDTLNKKLAAAVLEAAKESEVAYCVEGSVADDVSAQLVLKRSKEVRVFAGVSKADAAFAAARVPAVGRAAFSAR